MRLKDRVAKLEARMGEQLQEPKRPLPDWLQRSLELQEYIFDEAGHLLSSPTCERVEEMLPEWQKLLEAQEVEDERQRGREKTKEVPRQARFRVDQSRLVHRPINPF